MQQFVWLKINWKHYKWASLFPSLKMIKSRFEADAHIRWEPNVDILKTEDLFWKEHTNYSGVKSLVKLWVFKRFGENFFRRLFSITFESVQSFDNGYKPETSYTKNLFTARSSMIHLFISNKTLCITHTKNNSCIQKICRLDFLADDTFLWSRKLFLMLQSVRNILAEVFCPQIFRLKHLGHCYSCRLICFWIACHCKEICSDCRQKNFYNSVNKAIILHSEP